MTQESTIERRVRELLACSTADRKQSEEVLKLWRDNYKFSYPLAAKSGAGLVFLMLVFSLFATASLDDLHVFGLKFKSLDVPLVIVYASSGYALYRTVSLYCFVIFLREAIAEADYQLYARWYRHGLTALIDYPNIVQIEGAFTHSEKEGTFFERFSVAWLVTLVVTVSIAAAAWFAWSGFEVLRAPSIPRYLSIAAVVITALFIVRSTVILAQAVNRI